MEKTFFGVLHTRKLLALIVALVILAISCFGLSSCVEVTWEYILPRGYYISYFDDYDITLNDIEGFIITSGCITSFCYDSRYVCARIVDIGNKYANGKTVEEDRAELQAKKQDAPYFILDTETQEMYEDLSKEKFDALCVELEITNLCDWIDTDTKPERAYEVIH